MDIEIITVEQAETIIQSQVRDYGAEEIAYDLALGRVLAEDLFADRDLPPFNRATVDGIAIDFKGYEKGTRSFEIRATQSAGDLPGAISANYECIEIMTGAALDNSVDTVIRYEDLETEGGTATLKDIVVKQGQNIHRRAKDKKQGEVVAKAGTLITPALLGLAASIGKQNILVKKLPRVVIISTGNEMVSVETVPTPYQLRRSNGITIQSDLRRYGIKADMLHLNDDYDTIKKELGHCLQEYDILLMSGGVSMGKFDYIPQALEELEVKKLFHKVKQRPGKPFWFGSHDNTALIFAFPGNPVSVFMCLHRYFMPWLEKSFGITHLPECAILQSAISFTPPLQYFAQVKLSNQQGQILAEPLETNGSGDFSNLIYADAFIELPLDKQEFKKGEVYKVWRYNL